MVENEIMLLIAGTILCGVASGLFITGAGLILSVLFGIKLAV